MLVPQAWLCIEITTYHDCVSQFVFHLLKEILSCPYYAGGRVDVCIRDLCFSSGFPIRMPCNSRELVDHLSKLSEDTVYCHTRPWSLWMTVKPWSTSGRFWHVLVSCRNTTADIGMFLVSCRNTTADIGMFIVSCRNTATDFGMFLAEIPHPISACPCFLQKYHIRFGMSLFLAEIPHPIWTCFCFLQKYHIRFGHVLVSCRNTTSDQGMSLFLAEIPQPIWTCFLFLAEIPRRVV